MIPQITRVHNEPSLTHKQIVLREASHGRLKPVFYTSYCTYKWWEMTRVVQRKSRALMKTNAAF